MKAKEKEFKDIPINDGSKEFKQLVRDRLASSYDKSTWNTYEEWQKHFTEHCNNLINKRNNGKI